MTLTFKPVFTVPEIMISNVLNGVGDRAECLFQAVRSMQVNDIDFTNPESWKKAGAPEDMAAALAEEAVAEYTKRTGAGPGLSSPAGAAALGPNEIFIPVRPYPKI